MKVSVVIPVYNCERYISAAIESVLSQSYWNYEIIVVDDGSTDGTWEALAPYLPRIRYVYQNNCGEPTARNVGIEKASGEFIAFLDADDLWLPQKLEAQMQCFKDDRECGLVYTDMQTFDENGVIEESVRTCRNLDLPSGYVFARLFGETLFQTSSVVFRKPCLDKVGPFDPALRVGSDYDMWLRIARQFRMRYVDKPLVKYRQHSAMATRNISNALYDGIPWEAFVLNKILRQYPEAVEQLGIRVVKERLSKPYFNLAYCHLQLGHSADTREFMRQALGYWPTNLRYHFYYLISCVNPMLASVMRDLYRRRRSGVSGPTRAVARESETQAATTARS